jgi:hypothetical protein
MRRTRIEHMSAGLPPITDITRRDWDGRKVPNPEVGCAYSITSSARARRDAGIDTEQFRCLEIDDKQEFGGLLRSLEVCGLTGQINPTHIVDDQNEDRPRLGPSLIERFRFSAQDRAGASRQGRRPAAVRLSRGCRRSA